MIDTTRLFDIIEHRNSLYPTRPVFAHKENGTWVTHSLNHYIEQAESISYALLHKGYQNGENIALISSGRPEWNYIDFGVQMSGNVLVPIYPTISQEDYLFILSNAEVRIIFVENRNIFNKINAIKEQLPLLQDIVTIVPCDDTQSLDSIIALGKSHPQPQLLNEIKTKITTDDVATIIYTSGTTGTPKGVMLSHKNILTNVFGIMESPEKDWTRALSWMPLCHIYERMMNYLYQYLGMTTYYAENIAKVADNAQEVNPHIMAAVPRFIEKMYDKVFRKGEKLTPSKKKIFLWALQIGFDYELDSKKRSLCYNIKRFIADKLVYKEIRASLGANFRMLVSGGAAIQPRLTRFFSCVGLDLYEGYGLTECAPLVAVTNAYSELGRRIGSVGFPLPGIEVRFDPDSNEILCRGDNVMKGYYKAPDLTAGAIDSEGWFHTGDTGYADKDGFVFVTGRTKSIFKTSMGKFINPEIIEAKFKESPFVLDMMVVGEGEKYAAAIILPDFDMVRDWCKRHDVPRLTNEEIVSNKTVLDRYQRVLDKYNAQLGATEQIKNFVLVTETWTVENKMLTPTLKIRRKNIAAHYQKEITHLFNKEQATNS